MSFKIKEIPKDSKITKAICPICGRKLQSVGFPAGSTCTNITVVCKNCGKALTIIKD